ncbi:DM13 domain-containing protein [Spirosoma sp.]|nr:DM13 domain-containing protein [Spirosoma sp.]MBN8826868.1 DM13 domain-containing protein [Spirosoma sp.]OJW75547.1 MAG: hypothetical protein BGO59_08395 [Spirosoma sp. 48-14]
MKRGFLLLLIVVLAACVKDQELIPLGSNGTPVSVGMSMQPFDNGGQKLLAKGQFINGVHAVSGTVQLYEKDGQQTLVFTDFNSDTGPDLRIYLAADTEAKSFTEVTMLSATGNFYVPVPTGISMNHQRYVLIWCKRFSVHFGNAELN